MGANRAKGGMTIVPLAAPVNRLAVLFPWIWWGEIGMTLAISLILCSLVYPVFSVQERSDYIVVKDRYSNYDYAYSVRIPKGLTGLLAFAGLAS